MDDTVRKQVEDIQERSSERLRELLIFVLLLQVTFFAMTWLDTAEIDRAFNLQPPASLGEASSMALGYDTLLSAISIIFLFAIVVYFWRIRNKPLFQVLFIERKPGQRQKDIERFVTTFLMPLGISMGLAFMTIGYSVYSSHWWSSNETLLWSFQHNLLTYTSYPLIAVVCSCILLYVAYRIKPARVEDSTPALLFILILMSIGTVSYAIAHNALRYYIAEIQNTQPISGIPTNMEIVINFFLFSIRIIILVCFIVLSYLIYNFTTEDRKTYTFAEGKQLRGLIEEAMWILPSRVRAGDSHSISLYVKLCDDFVSRACSGKCSYESSDYIEAELQAIELKVDADKKQLRICETSPIPITTWNCGFPAPGWHTINVMINVVKQIDNTKDTVFVQQHDVKVESLANVSVAPVIIGIAPLLITLAQTFLRSH